ncbi:hypothetical protein K470DRAFT_257495 [Piedraia hortae CBS 480.64]|uniref:Uncharacterized protein n=1 Tax=Piedraia hortae CBS 480.64 TaxID=1314780 RepID=A0A6A7C139_9PEZI|nr:hypothetical protein K470DRAFT_257495 [Piedraia hortae CBS 480.64]
MSPVPLTLTFLSYKTSITLLASASTPLPTLRAELLRALHQTYSDGIFNGLEIPAHQTDILLARGVEGGEGWEALDEPMVGVLVDGEGVEKGKGNSMKQPEREAETVGSKGLKDGDVLAFKFREFDEDEGDPFLDQVREQWNVTVPVCED